MNGAKFHVYTHINSRFFVVCYLSQNDFTACQTIPMQDACVLVRARERNNDEKETKYTLHCLCTLNLETVTHMKSAAHYLLCGWIAFSRCLFSFFLSSVWRSTINRLLDFFFLVVLYITHLCRTCSTFISIWTKAAQVLFAMYHVVFHRYGSKWFHLLFGDVFARCLLLCVLDVFSFYFVYYICFFCYFSVAYFFSLCCRCIFVRLPFSTSLSLSIVDSFEL